MSYYDPIKFLIELEELEKDKNGDGWTILRTAITLRRLLFDQGQTLTAIINRDENVKLQFEVGVGIGRGIVSGGGDATANGFWSATDGLLPETVPERRRCILPLKKFLQHVVLEIGKWEYSIKDVIEFCAYNHGVIHAKDTAVDDDKNQALLKWSKQGIRPHGLPAEVDLMRHIITIVLRGLEPLKEAVQLRMKTSG